MVDLVAFSGVALLALVVMTRWLLAGARIGVALDAVAAQGPLYAGIRPDQLRAGLSGDRADLGDRSA